MFLRKNKILVAILLGLSLTACGGSDSSDVETPDISIPDSGSGNSGTDTSSGSGTQTDKKLTLLTELKGELPSPSDGYIFANEHGVYHWQENAGFIDIVLRRPDGEVSTYSLSRDDYGSGLFTNLPIDSVAPDQDKVDNGYYYEEVEIPVEKEGVYYFSTIKGTHKDGRDDFHDWAMSFDSDGAPAVKQVELTEPACSQVYTVGFTCDISWVYAKNLNNADRSDDVTRSGLPFDELYSTSHSAYRPKYRTAGLLVNGHWYGFTNQSNSQLSLVVVNPERKAEYFDINVNDASGSPMRDMEATTLRYHPEQNAIYFIARGPGLTTNEYLVGEYKIETKKLQWVKTEAIIYYKLMSNIALADGGIYILSDGLGQPRYYESATNTVSLVDVKVPTARIPYIVAPPFMLPNGNFLYVEKIANWDLRESRIVQGTVE